MEPVLPVLKTGANMKTNGQHQKDAITTDKKNRVDDEHILELDKQRLKESEKQASPTARPGKKVRD
jgi:hypothetical protein